ncbi:MAG TPA: hypothetical protein VGQ61_17770, partial [Candidatus Angelobacter sp.]|nr:hypothetical protein [Candidatus Angelobacter sp.]
MFTRSVILHEMVTGSKPFPEVDGSNNDAHLSTARSKLVKQLPLIWADAIRPCLAPLPEKRPSAEQILAVLNRKPIYRRPWVAIAALVLLAAGAFLWRPIYEYFRPPDISLAFLPVQSTGDLQHIGEGVLYGVAERLRGEPKGKPKFRLISPDAVAKKGVATPGQAESILHATHALQLELHRDGNDIAVEAEVVD